MGAEQSAGKSDLICGRLGCGRQFSEGHEAGCHYHLSQLTLKKRSGVRREETFVLYWCCGATDRNAKGCRKGKHEPYVEQENKKNDLNASLQDTMASLAKSEQEKKTQAPARRPTYQMEKQESVPMDLQSNPLVDAQMRAGSPKKDSTTYGFDSSASMRNSKQLDGITREGSRTESFNRTNSGPTFDIASDKGDPRIARPMVKTNSWIGVGENSSVKEFLGTIDKDQEISLAILKKDGDEGFGFQLTDVSPSGETGIGIYVISLVPNTNAAEILHLHDKIQAVNGFSVEGMTLEQVMEFITENTSPSIELLVLRQRPATQSFVL